MNQAGLQYLKISNFKSIDTLELKNLYDFSVFAGANGSGKSNFFDALDFISCFMCHGITDALREQGGFDNIHSIQQNKDYTQRFEFEVECTLPNVQDNLTEAKYKYQLIINKLDTEPEIREQLFINEKQIIIRNECFRHELPKELQVFPSDYSGLSFVPQLPLSALLRNLRLYRIDPFGAVARVQSDQDSSVHCAVIPATAVI